MITKKELISLLLESSSGVSEIQARIQISPLFLNDIAERLILKNASYELPSYALFKTEPESINLFQKILLKTSQLYKENELSTQQREMRLTTLMQEFRALITRGKTLLEEKKEVDSESIRQILSELCGFFSISDLFSLRGFLNIRASDLLLKKGEGVTLDSLSLFERGFEFLATRPVQYPSYPLSEDLWNALMILSLKLHSKQCTSDVSSKNGAIRMIHFYSASSTDSSIKAQHHSSEHLDAFDSSDENDNAISFDKTNHGLGSGVYGLAKLTDEEIQSVVKYRKSYFKIFEIRNPLRLYDDKMLKESDAFSSLSKYLQYACDIIKSEHSKIVQNLPLHLLAARTGAKSAQEREHAVRCFFENDQNSHDLSGHAETLLRFKNIRKLHFSTHQMYDILLLSTIEFFVKANRKNGYLTPMPINYVIKRLGFTGVSSVYNDRFNRGLIAIETPTDEPLLQVGIKLKPKSTSPFCSELSNLDDLPLSRMDIWDRPITPSQLSNMGSLHSSRYFYPASADKISQTQHMSPQKFSPSNRSKRAASLTALGQELFLMRTEKVDTGILDQMLKGRVSRTHSLDSEWSLSLLAAELEEDDKSNASQIL